MKINYFLLLLFCLGFEGAIAQLTFHQDIFYGGVTMGGFSTDHQSYGSTGDNPLELYIEPGSTIRNAYLFHYQVGPSITSTVTLNGTDFVFTGEDEILNAGHSNSIATPVRYLYEDITDYLNNNMTNIFNIEVESEVSSNFGGFSAFIYIEYENPTLEKVCSNFVINDQFIDGNLNMNIVNMTTMALSNPVGLACYFDNITPIIDDDWESININNNFLGEIGGTDNSNGNIGFAPGVRGHFFYQNQFLLGLDDDYPNNTMDSTDALANISDYITNINSYTLNIYENGLVSSNYPLFFVNTYTTLCDTFSTAIIPYQTICQGDSILLSATGGNTSYLWSNTSTLSDSVSETVLAFPDSTTRYIVKIENEPGCYRTEEVTVFVDPVPQINSIDIFPATCGGPTDGFIQINIVTDDGDPFQYSNGEGLQWSDSFEDLLSGEYHIEVVNNFGCMSDSLIILPTENTTNAFFEATPLQGDEPLEVQTTNLSSNANNYQWYLNEEFFSNNQNPPLILDINGVYQLDLIAYNNLPLCADTFSLEIIVYNALLVQIPNIFTPNDNGINDAFSVKTDDVDGIKLEIFNRWGNKVFDTIKTINPTLQTTPLWDGKNTNRQKVANGTYYYIIEIARPNGERLNYQGNIMVIE